MKIKLLLFLNLIGSFAFTGWASDSPGAMSCGEALKRLLDGNARFVEGKKNELNGAQLIARRQALTKEQKPFAVIISCSDSRVPPELVFDAGLGDIFVVRTAGEVVDAVSMGSVEYAIEHLGVTLIMVLGHERCGAVSAAVSQASERGSVPAVLRAIAPAVEESKGKSGDLVDNVVRANAIAVARRLAESSPIIAPLVQSGSVKIVAARYALDTGTVELMK